MPGVGLLLRSGLGLLAVASLLLGLYDVASAHTLQENNGVSAVLHIPPDDNPVAARPTTLNFAFGGANFRLDDCDCKVTVQSDGKMLQEVTLKRRPDSALDTSAEVTFPVIGVYDVVVTGTSKSHSFQTFSLRYIERVATSAAPIKTVNNNHSRTILVSGGFVLLAMSAYATVRRRRGPKRNLDT